MKGLRRFVIPLMVGIISCPVFSNPIIAHPEMEKYLNGHGVILESCYLAGSYKRLIELFDIHINYIENDIEYKDKPDYVPKYPGHEHLKKIPITKEEKLLPFLENGRYMLRNSTTEPEKKYACYLSTRLLYSFVSLSDVNRRAKLADFQDFTRGIKIARSVKFPQNSKTFAKRKLGQERAMREANFLIAEGVRTKSELTGNELSKVDIRDDDPLFNSDIHLSMDQKNGNQRVEAFYNKFDLALTKYVQEKHQDSNIQYKLSDGKKTLFLKEIKRFRKKEGTGHIPTLKTHDEMSVDYQMNFRRIPSIEPVINHLHLAMGGNYSAIKSAHNNENPVILILNQKNSNTKANEKSLLGLKREKVKHMHVIKEKCSKIATYRTLKKCFELSHFHFRNFSPFVIEHGTIDNSNLNRLVTYDKTPIKDLQNIIGREYVILKHVSLELRNNQIFHMGGAVPMSSMGSETSRSHRASGIFHMFIQNPRVKDFHYRTVVLNPEYFPHLQNKNKFQRYYEFPYSTERALGHNIMISSLKNFHQVPDGKMAIKSPAPIKGHFISHNYLKRNRLIYQRSFILSPKSWDYATTADNAWMARRMTSTLTDEVIQEAVKKAHLSRAWENATAKSLIERKNRLQTLYKLLSKHQ